MSQEIKAIVTDIEGTTSSLSFVKDILFPYAYKNLPDYIWENEAELKDLLNDVRKEENNTGLSLEEVIEVLLRYMDDDQKITSLKTLQGMIWKDGYEAGELEGHIYVDALNGLKRWKEQGIDLYVYSSGSIAAQKLLFANTSDGDLTSLFSGYFDTTTGPKKDVESYEKIAASIKVAASDILFLSDSTDEISAAAAAGMNVIILDREKTLLEALGYSVMHDFNEILEEVLEA